jgi:hypothetical protein
MVQPYAKPRPMNRIAIIIAAALVAASAAHAQKTPKAKDFIPLLSTAHFENDRIDGETAEMQWNLRRGKDFERITATVSGCANKYGKVTLASRRMGHEVRAWSVDGGTLGDDIAAATCEAAAKSSK